MKLLCKLILLVLAAKLLASPPKEDHGVLGQISSLTVHDVACGINNAWTGVETWISGVWTSQMAPAKAADHRGTAKHHPVS
jgi:hypothetical protein